MIIATDWDRWIGFCNDPAEVGDRYWIGWLRFPEFRGVQWSIGIGKQPGHRLPRPELWRYP